MGFAAPPGFPHTGEMSSSFTLGDTTWLLGAAIATAFLGTKDTVYTPSSLVPIRLPYLRHLFEGLLAQDATDRTQPSELGRHYAHMAADYNTLGRLMVAVGNMVMDHAQGKAVSTLGTDLDKLGIATFLVSIQEARHRASPHQQAHI